MSDEFIVPTGQIIKEYLIENNITQKDLSKRIGLSEKHISNLLNGNSRLTEEVAIKLESIFPGIPASYWLNFEIKYREYIAREERNYKLNAENLTEIAKRFRFNEVFSGLNWNIQKQAHEMLKILQISDYKNFEDSYSNLNVDFMEDGGNLESIAIWLNLCREEIEIQNKDLDEIDYNKDTLLKNLNKFKMIANNKELEISLNSARKLCNRLGIYLVTCEAITNSKVRGALTTYRNHPAIYLSHRFRKHDYIWFALMHEIGHLVLHYNPKETLISFEEDLEVDKITESITKEDEANIFSRNFFINPMDYSKFIDGSNFTEKKVIDFAQQQNVQPGIVVARLQHDKYIKFSQLTHLK